LLGLGLGIIFNLARHSIYEVIYGIVAIIYFLTTKIDTKIGLINSSSDNDILIYYETFRDV